MIMKYQAVRGQSHGPKEGRGGGGGGGGRGEVPKPYLELTYSSGSCAAYNNIIFL